MAHIAIVGGGVSGLSAALVLSRRGHRITLIERDDTPMPASADEAFAWDRRGAPQVRHSHAFLARLVNLLRNEYPDVLQRLLDEGAFPLRFADGIPPTITDYEPEPGDDDLTLLACRRTTYEWVLRDITTKEGNVTIRTGNGVVGFTTADQQPAGDQQPTDDQPTGDQPTGDQPSGDGGASLHPITVTGVRLDDGSTVAADIVVTAGGRRSNVPEWLAGVGAPVVAEEVEDTGIVYFSRWYKLKPGHEYPPRNGPIGGDLGYLKYGVFVGDNDTFSVTLATPTEDDHLRKTLSDPAVFDACAQALVVTQVWLDGRAEPIVPDVHVMAGLLNRWREYVPNGQPVALGFHAVGDALVCTNPLYGRGCSTAFWAADLLGDAIDAEPFDKRRQAVAYDAAIRDEILPWYRSTVMQDAEARRVAEALLAGDDPDADTTDPRTFIRAVLRDGLLPAIRTDLVVLRAFLRNMNLITDPESLMKDANVSGRIFAVWQDRENRPPEPVLGPASRSELLELLPGAA